MCAAADEKASPFQEPAPALPGGRAVALGVLASASAVLTTVGSIHWAGIWDPVELENAELARRIAGRLLGAPELLEAPAEPVPTRGELGRGELPFTLMALGFRAFGLSTWAGRLPLAVFGLAGLVALAVFVRRLGGARAGWLSVLVLSTSPLYFLHARAMLGDIVTMAAHAGVMAGLGLAVFDRSRTIWRLVALLLALMALGTGFGSGGVLLGVALPTLGVGIAWLVLALGGARQDRLGESLGAGSLGTALVAVGLGVYAFVTTPGTRYSLLLAAFGAGTSLVPTFEVMARDLAHAMFPWSAVIPWAIGRLFAPAVAAPGVSVERVHALRVVLLSSAAVTWLGQAWLLPRLGTAVFVAPAALAAIVALALHDFDCGAPPSRAFGLCVAALGAVLLLDFRNFPEKLLTPFGMGGVAVPEALESSGWLALAMLAAFSVCFFLLHEGSEDGQRAFQPETYRAWPRTLRRLWAGNLLFGVLVVASALALLLLLSTVSEHVGAFAGFGEAGEMSRLFVRLGLCAVLGFCALPVLVSAARDTTRFAVAPARHFPFAARFGYVRRLRFGRGAGAAVALSAAAALASFVFYPGVLDAMSPKEAADAYRRVARSGEPLGLFGIEARALRYHAGGSVQELGSVDAALAWLLRGGGRRFLMLRASDLATLNAAYRSKRPQEGNLPIVAVPSREMLLAASYLAPHEENGNPLDAWVLDRPPKPARHLDVDLGGKLDVLGWDVLDARGESASAVVPGETYEFVIYYRVTERLAGNWDTFIHVDGFQRRFNGDHVTLGGKYPMSLWRRGDYIADKHPIRLEPHFAPGSYQVFFGLYNGSRRLEVRRGMHDENRVIAGALTVR